jgi:hypothetical protein
LCSLSFDYFQLFDEIASISNFTLALSESQYLRRVRIPTRLFEEERNKGKLDFNELVLRSSDLNIFCSRKIPLALLESMAMIYHATSLDMYCGGFFWGCHHKAARVFSFGVTGKTARN